MNIYPFSKEKHIFSSLKKQKTYRAKRQHPITSFFIKKFLEIGLSSGIAIMSDQTLFLNGNAYKEKPLNWILSCKESAERENASNQSLINRIYHLIHERSFIQEIKKNLCFLPIGKMENSYPQAKWNNSLLPLEKMGLYTEEHQSKFFKVKRATRSYIREETKNEIKNAIGYPKASFIDIKNITPKMFCSIPIEIKKQLEKICLYSSSSSYNTFKKDTQLLGRFDVLQSPCVMDYDASWKRHLSAQRPFLVHHSAAINVGESSCAEDFADYALEENPNELDEKKYIEDMGEIFFNILQAQEKSGALHAVWFPFGMGAFLRNLCQNDPSYPSIRDSDQTKLFNLRLKITKKFIEQVEKFPRLKIHMCLPKQKEKSESTQNYNAFVQAFAEAPKRVQKQTKFHINCDATDIAQQLANRLYNVSLVNGANRNLLGNCWFSGGAYTAIDENLHRRSSLLSLVSLLLNDGTEKRSRKTNELTAHIRNYGGKIIRDMRFFNCTSDCVAKNDSRNLKIRKKAKASLSEISR